MGKNTALIVGWALALVLGSGLYLQVQANRALDADLAAAQQEAQDAGALAGDLERRYGALEAAMEASKETDATPTSTLTPTKGIEIPESFSPADLFKNMLGGTKDAAGGTQGNQSAPANPFSAMFEGEQGEKMMKASIGMAMNMQYGDLFKSLNLPEDRAHALREVLRAHMEDEAMTGLAAMRGEFDWQGGEDSDAALLADLAEILTPEELAEYEQYTEEMPERMIRQQYEMQINMFMPGMREEVRNYTVDVLVEAMLPLEGDQSSPGTFANPMDQVRAHMEAAGARLDAELAPEDAEQARAFIDQQLAGIDMVSAMMGGSDSESESGE